MLHYEGLLTYLSLFVCIRMNTMKKSFIVPLWSQVPLPDIYIPIYCIAKVYVGTEH